MDIIDRHFAAENAHDVQATLDTYTDDIVWDDVTNPDSPFRGKEAVARVYSRNHRGHSRRDADIGQALHRRGRSLRRGRVDHLRPRPRGVGGMAGGGAPVEARMLHVFEIRDGLICS